MSTRQSCRSLVAPFLQLSPPDCFSGKLSVTSCWIAGVLTPTTVPTTWRYWCDNKNAGVSTVRRSRRWQRMTRRRPGHTTHPNNKEEWLAPVAVDLDVAVLGQHTPDLLAEDTQVGL